jgi:hypothetical protein
MRPIVNFMSQDMRARIADCITAWPDPCERRFVRLYCELVAVAASVRFHRSEPELTPDDLRCALGFASWFLNSFKHQ